MAEKRAHAAGGGDAGRGDPGAGDAAGFDRELDLRSIVAFGIGLLLLTIVVLATVWLMMEILRSRSLSRDPRPSPLAEANAPKEPPAPRLQSAPVEDMRALRAAEETMLHSYGWVDRDTAIARIPVDRAIDIVAERGLPAALPEPDARGAGTPAPPKGPKPPVVRRRP